MLFHLRLQLIFFFPVFVFFLFLPVHHLRAEFLLQLVTYGIGRLKLLGAIRTDNSRRHIYNWSDIKNTKFGFMQKPLSLLFLSTFRLMQKRLLPIIALLILCATA